MKPQTSASSSASRYAIGTSKLCWTVRASGLLLALSAGFLWQRDLLLSTTDDWFFGLTAFFGLLMIVATLVPVPVAPSSAQSVRVDEGLTTADHPTGLRLAPQRKRA